MEVQHLPVTEAGELADFFNEQISATPFCFPVSPKVFEHGVRYSFDMEEEETPWPQVSEETLVVCRDNGRIMGFSHNALEWRRMSKAKGLGGTSYTGHYGRWRIAAIKPHCF